MGPVPAGGIGCRAAGAAHGARRAGPVPGRPAANPHRGCRLRAPSRSADPRRSHGVASRSRSAHAARGPRTAALGGSQRSPSFRRVARPGLSLPTAQRLNGSPSRGRPLTITHRPSPFGYSHYVIARCGFVYTNRRSSDLRTQTILPPARAGGRLRPIGTAPVGALRTTCAPRANRACRRSRPGLATSMKGGLHGR